MIKHNIEEEPKLMALPEGTSVTVEGITGKLTIKPYPAGYENTIKVVLEYMGEMDEDLFDDFDEAVGNTFDELIEFYRKHGGGFVEDKKSVAFRKPTLIEIYEFNAFTNLMSLVLNTNKKKTLMSIQET
jgi:hypothetical protein